jgi:hypothetical protein
MLSFALIGSTIARSARALCTPRNRLKVAFAVVGRRPRRRQFPVVLMAGAGAVSISVAVFTASGAGSDRPRAGADPRLASATAGRPASAERSAPASYSARDADYPLTEFHERAVKRFVEKEGFGFERMLTNHQPQLDDELRKESIDIPAGPGFDASRRAPLAVSKTSSRIEHPASPARRGKLRTFELISVLVRPKPEVYTSAGPGMGKRRPNAPTRPLDTLEQTGLERLRRGDDLVITQQTGGVRMIGAIRSAETCVKCHQGKPGELLGAFTYTLDFERAGTEKPKAPH